MKIIFLLQRLNVIFNVMCVLNIKCLLYSYVIKCWSRCVLRTLFTFSHCCKYEKGKYCDHVKFKLSFQRNTRIEVTESSKEIFRHCRVSLCICVYICCRRRQTFIKIRLTNVLNPTMLYGQTEIAFFCNNFIRCNRQRICVSLSCRAAHTLNSNINWSI